MAQAPQPAIEPRTRSVMGLDMPSLGARFQKAEADNAAAMGRIAEAEKARGEAMAPLEAQVRQNIQTRPEAPKLAPVPDKFQHSGMSGEELTQATQAMFAFAAIGGMMTRQPMTAAMNAYSGALQGFVKGDQLLFNREKETFDRNLKQAIAKNDQALKEYQAAAQKHQGDLSAMMTEWKLISSKYGDTVAAAQIEANNAKSMMQHVESLAKLDEQMRRTDKQFQIQMAKIGQSFQPPAPDQQTVEMLAQRYIGGDPSALTGLGYGKNSQPLREAILRRAAELTFASGKGGSDIAGARASYKADESSLRQYQNYANRLEALGGKINKDIDTLLTVADKGVGPTGTPMLDKWIQMGRKGLGDPDVSAFETQIQTVKNEYGRAMSGPASNAQLTVAAMKHADDLINSAQNMDQLKSVISVMRQDIKNQTQVAEEQIGQIKNRLSGSRTPGRRLTDIPSSNSKGWKLHTDASGNRAYVGPNNEIEEVQ